MRLHAAVRIVSIDTIEGCLDHERLQQRVWGDDPPESVPAHLLIALAHNGGVILGAYAGEQMIGALLGLPALREGRLIHLSHMLCTHPDWRGRGIGEALKWRQREIVLAQGIDLISWTFDPLEAANARLNLARLGGIVSVYRRDYYGPMADALNRGFPSDRFMVQWHIASPRVRERARQGAPRPPGDTAPVVLAAGRDGQGRPCPSPFTMPGGATALLEIPANIQQLKRVAPELALQWRLAVRDACERLFAAGYGAMDVTRRDGRVCYYLEQLPA